MRREAPHELTTVTLRDALLLPFPRRSYTGGMAGSFVLDSNAVPIANGVMHRGVHVVEAAHPPGPPRRLEGRHVYGGTLFHHFGHFLVESLARAWWLRHVPDQPVAWHAHGRPLGAHNQAIFALLGLRAPSAPPLMEPVIVDELTVPAPGAIMGRWLSAAQASALGVCPSGPPRPERRVWLSRSRLSEDRGSIEGETSLEAVLAEHGWDIVAPETLTVPEQLSALAGAGEIAGFMGSAFHLLMLLDKVEGRVRLVDRRLPPRDCETYRAIASGKGFRQEEIRMDLEIIEGRGARARLRLSDPRRAAESLVR
jgi:capsular polysaccharide biosynthesis protein